VDAVTAARKLARLLGKRTPDLAALRELYHPDARLCTVLGGKGDLSPDDAIAALQRAAESNWYSLTIQPPVAIDEFGAILEGRLRRSVAAGAFADNGYAWAVTDYDGLIYRQAFYSTAAQASDAYRQLGVHLGILTTPAMADAAGDAAAARTAGTKKRRNLGVAKPQTRGEHHGV
jgi:hypothetical protein